MLDSYFDVKALALLQPQLLFQCKRVSEARIWTALNTTQLF
jgi:hypothetical protein